MDPGMFHKIVARISHRIQRKDTWYRQALPAGLKLAITLRYLASGDSYHSLMYGFRVSHSTISLFIPKVCEAIVAEYAEEVVQTPTTPEEWKRVSGQFSQRWQFHHALGAIDGRHVHIKCPKHGGSIYYNYKGFHSIILLALVGANYKFLWVDVGGNGSASDCQIFNGCYLKEAIDSSVIGFPPADPLPGDDRPTPYSIIGDDAFPLRTWMMKPYSRRNMPDPESIINYRLSRARRIVENAFGILGNKWQCLVTSMRQKTKTVESIVLACVCLHNLMRLRYPGIQNAVLDQEDDQHNIIPGAWRPFWKWHNLTTYLSAQNLTRVEIVLISNACK